MGVMEKYGHVIISVRKEEPTSGDDIPYRIMMRTKTPNIGRREVFYSSQLKKTFLGKKPSPKQLIQLLDKEANFSKLLQIEATPELEAKIQNLEEFKVYILLI
jgi:hypothetical protein